MEVKICTVCKLEKDVCLFDIDNSIKSKIASRCKECQSIKNKKYIDKNKAKIKASKSNWYKQNRNVVITKNKIKRKTNPVNQLISVIKHRANNKNLPFNLTKEDIVIPEYCPVLGLRLEVADGLAKDNSPSIDRIIPNLGYVRGNIQVISNLANKMKTNASIEHLLLFSKWVLKTFEVVNEQV